MCTQRLERLRSRMRESGVDAYLVPTSDFHGSEYVGDYFKCREYITGFTGSAGTAVITLEEACLWTDGRYFVQAARQLEGSGFRLMRSGQPEVPTVEEYLQRTLPVGGTLGFDGRVISESQGERIQEELRGRGVRFQCQRPDRGDLGGQAASLRAACVDSGGEICRKRRWTEVERVA